MNAHAPATPPGRVCDSIGPSAPAMPGPHRAALVIGRLVAVVERLPSCACMGIGACRSTGSFQVGLDTRIPVKTTHRGFLAGLSACDIARMLAP